MIFNDELYFQLKNKIIKWILQMKSNYFFSQKRKNLKKLFKIHSKVNLGILLIH
jgi:hypothetical protein